MVRTRRGRETGRLEEQRDRLNAYARQQNSPQLSIPSPLSESAFNMGDIPEMQLNVENARARYRPTDIYKRHRLPDSAPYNEFVPAHYRRERDR